MINYIINCMIFPLGLSILGISFIFISLFYLFFLVFSIEAQIKNQGRDQVSTLFVVGSGFSAIRTKMIFVQVFDANSSFAAIASFREPAEKQGNLIHYFVLSEPRIFP